MTRAAQPKLPVIIQLMMIPFAVIGFVVAIAQNGYAKGKALLDLFWGER